MSQSKPSGGSLSGGQGKVGPLLHVEHAAEVDLAQFAVGRCTSWPPGSRGAAVLRAHLHDALVLAGRLDHLAAFPRIVAERLFHVHVLAGLAGPNRGQRVPMVGRGDHDGIDRLVVQDAAEILHGFGALPWALVIPSSRVPRKSAGKFSTKAAGTVCVKIVVSTSAR